MLGQLFWIGSLLGAGSLLAAELQLDFNRFPLNETPPGFTQIVGGQGRPAEWKVILDEVPSMMSSLFPEVTRTYQRGVLAQLSEDPTDEHFPMLAYEEETFADFTLTTRLKLVRGQAEQMAGIAFRLRDVNNYYYIRASSLGNTFNFFKVVNGLRSQPIGRQVVISNNVWHTLTIECRGTTIRGLLNGQELIPPLNDLSFGRGKIAFWTKSDTVAYFTDTRIDYKPIVTLAEKLVQRALTDYSRLLGLKIAAFPLQGDSPQPILIASDQPEEMGQPAWPEEANVIRNGSIYHVKKKGEFIISMPLRDRNGEPAAAVRLVMKRFPGQSEKNAVARATIVVKSMQARPFTRQDLFE